MQLTLHIARKFAAQLFSIFWDHLSKECLFDFSRRKLEFLASAPTDNKEKLL